MNKPLILCAKVVLYGYRWFVSWLWTPCCRFTPSCSEYSLKAIEIHGFWRGSWLTLKRLSRCHPWGAWGVDPVPPFPSSIMRKNKNKKSSWRGARYTRRGHPENIK